MIKRVLVASALVLTASACSGDVKVATVDGVALSLSDIPVHSAGFSVPEEAFLNALNWEIRERVLLAAADAEFGIRLDEAEVAISAQQILDGLSAASRSDPRANLAYFETQARVAQSVGLLWPLLAEAVGGEQGSATDWANDRLRAANVEVNERFGVWRLTPEPLVYPE